MFRHIQYTQIYQLNFFKIKKLRIKQLLIHMCTQECTGTPQNQTCSKNVTVGWRLCKYTLKSLVIVYNTEVK